MAGKLVQVATNTVSSAVASVTLTGIDSDDVYMVAINNVTHDHTGAASANMRFTKDVSGTPTPITSANYQRATKELRVDSAFSNAYVSVNATAMFLEDTGDLANEQYNSILYLFNFNNSSEYSFCTYEGQAINSDGNLRGRQGGFSLNIAEEHNGIQFFLAGGHNIETGTFTLYKVI